MARTETLTVETTDLPPEDPAAVLLGFYEASQIAAAYDAEHWSPAEETRLLAAIARSYATDAGAALRAMEVLAKRRLDSLRYAGHLARITAVQHVDDQGRTTKQVSISAANVAKDALQRTLDYLKEGSRTRAVLPTNENDANRSNDSPASDGPQREPLAEETNPQNVAEKLRDYPRLAAQTLCGKCGGPDHAGECTYGPARPSRPRGSNPT